jgi:hypothetical protein
MMDITPGVIVRAASKQTQFAFRTRITAVVPAPRR